MKKINQAIVAESMDYTTYRQTIDDLYADGKATGGYDSEAMLHYTFMNVTRMKRLDKTTRLNEAVVEQLKSVDTPQIWLTLTEGWCGDAAQIIPVLEKMAGENDQIKTRYILRDEHLDIMDAFLTNGGRSIPKVLILDANSLEVLNTWGPRPKAVQDLMVRTKKDLSELTSEAEKMALNEEVKKQIQLMYAKDKTQAIQSQFVAAVV